MKNLLDELAAYRDRFVAEGDILMSSMIDDLIQGMETALNSGFEFSSEIIDAMRTAIETGDLDFLNAVRNMIGYYNTFAETGIVDINEMSKCFTQALSLLNDNQQMVLQSMYDNILTVLGAASEMQKVVANAQFNAKGPNGSSLIGTEITPYSEGGVVDYTGPAAVHGSKSHPEVVFNADAAAKLYNYVVNTPDLLKSAFAGITADSSMLKGASQINNAPSIGDININISGNADADTVLKFKQLAGQLRDEVVKSLNDSMNRRGIMRSPRVI